MTDSIAVAAFVFGLVLLIAALLGKDLKIAAVEMPALNRTQRIIAAAIGVFLVFFGLTDGRAFLRGALSQATATPAVSAAVATDAPPQAAAPTSPPLAQNTPAAASPTDAASAAVPVTGGASGACFSEISANDRLTIGLERNRADDRQMSSGQPRDATLVVELKTQGAIIGAVKFQTFESGVGFDILGVVDAACNPVTGYKNITRSDQPKESPYNWDTLEYQFGSTPVSMAMNYSEDIGQVSINAWTVSP